MHFKTIMVVFEPFSWEFLVVSGSLCRFVGVIKLDANSLLHNTAVLGGTFRENGRRKLRIITKTMPVHLSTKFS